MILQSARLKRGRFLIKYKFELFVCLPAKKFLRKNKEEIVSGSGLEPPSALGGYESDVLTASL